MDVSDPLDDWLVIVVTELLELWLMTELVLIELAGTLEDMLEITSDDVTNRIGEVVVVVVDIGVKVESVLYSIVEIAIEAELIVDSVTVVVYVATTRTTAKPF